MRILIVDDDDMALMFARHVLERAGHEVDEARNGLEALDRLRRGGGAYHAVVTDRDMPHMDGLALCRAIRSDPHLAGTYVVLLSADVTPAAGLAEPGGWADAAIPKPLNPRALIAAVLRGGRRVAGDTPD